MMLYHILFIVISLLESVYSCIRTLESHTKRRDFKCCQQYDERFLNRVEPPLATTSFGWSQKSGLKYYEERICPTHAIYECNINRNTNATEALIQFIDDNNTVIYENSDVEHIPILVYCVDGEWILNGQTFSAISCSESFMHTHEDPSKFHQYIEAFDKIVTKGKTWHFKALVMFPGLDKIPIITSFIKSRYFKNLKEMARLGIEQIEECKKTYNFNDEL
uniref:START domain-containing protein n=1 Tax=Parastrongyloides trichosuri TaxID=131310 RepID=A0A0N5A2B7_PARTI